MLDLLSNIPAGGMSPFVALHSVVPALNLVLKMFQWKTKKNSSRRSQIHDYFDRCFLLTKKILFCTDTHRRQVAVSILIMLLGISVDMPPQSSAFNHKSETPKKDTTGMKNAHIEEIMSYLRRCLTQHQADVRFEVYTSLMSLCPPVAHGDISLPNSPVASYTQNSINHFNSIQNVTILRSTISKILLNQLERYVNIGENKAMREARRLRAIQHGSQLSQAIDSDDDKSNHSEEIPMKIELCFSLNNVNKCKKGSGILTEVLSYIVEPIVYLISVSCAVVSNMDASNKSGAESDLKALLNTLLKKLADSTYDKFLEPYRTCAYNDGVDSGECKKMFLALLLLTAISDTLMGHHSAISSNDGEIDFEIVEKLFNLRCQSIEKASLLLDHLISMEKSTSSKNKKSTTKAKNSNELNMQNEPVNESSLDLILESTLENQSTKLKATKSIENAIDTLCPNLSCGFLGSCLRLCGVSSYEKGENDNLYHSNDEIKAESSIERLRRSTTFRHFILYKSNIVLGEKSFISEPGYRFDSLPNYEANKDVHDFIGKHYIAASLQLGPLLLNEFFFHSKYYQDESLKDSTHKTLSQLSIDGFVLTARRISVSADKHPMTKVQRLSTLLRFSFDNVKRSFTTSKSGFEKFSNAPTYLKRNVSQEESDLFMLLGPIIGSNKATTDTSDSDALFCGGILAQMVANSMDEQVASCCDLILSIAVVFNNPVIREEIIVCTMKSLDKSNCPNIAEIIDLKNDVTSFEKYECPMGATRAVDVGLILDGLLDGSCPPLTSENPSYVILKMPLSFTSDSIDKYSNITFRDSFNEFQNDKFMGLSYRVSLAFLSKHDIGPNFELCSVSNFVKGSCDLPCINILADTEKDLKSKNRISVTDTMSSIIQCSMYDSEFIVFKIMPHVKGNSLRLLQRFLYGRMYIISKIFSTMCFFADKIELDGSFVIFLLKLVKRFYALHSRIVLYNITEPKYFMCAESRNLLHVMATKMTPRTMALLLTMQELLHSGHGKKYLAESKIRLHGRVAADVVFEKEKSDNALMKIISRLKTCGYEREYKWLEKKVVISTSRDFRIKKDGLRSIKRINSDHPNKKESSKNGRRSTKKRKVIEDTQDEEIDDNLSGNDGQSISSSLDDSNDDDANDEESLNTLSDTDDET